MRCKRCDYRLWNLTSRACPECGLSFAPSHYEFKPNSVQFCCPDCRQAYYGTTAKGHLQPIAFACGGCGRRLHMDDMILLPTAGVDEERTAQAVMPWLQRRALGRWRAWLATIGQSLVSPGRLIQCVPVDSALPTALVYATFTTGAFLFAGWGVLLLPGVVAQWVSSSAMAATLSMILGIAIGLGGIGLGFALYGVLVHGLLRLTGRTAQPLRRTCQAVCYSAGANVLSATPCVGPYFGWIWWLVSMTLMVRHAQQVHPARAGLAVLALPVLSLGGLMTVGTYSLLTTWSIAGRPGGIRAIGAAAAGDEDSAVQVRAVLDFAAHHGGSGPDHALQLITEEYLSAYDFVAAASATDEDAIILGPAAAGRGSAATLGSFGFLEADRQEALVQTLVDAPPEGMIAHRLGDFVFCHHGIDLSQPDPQLWLVIQVPDPDQNPSPTMPLAVGMASGRVIRCSPALLQRLLGEQNRRRAAAGLPALPDPRTITHTAPATSGR